jgi:hypothetical protein
MSGQSEKVPKAMTDTFGAVTAITDGFCADRLNGEYAQLIRFATAALCRKRPSPLAKGTALSWAAAIAHAVGLANYLYDPAAQPHLPVQELYNGFGVSQSNALTKSKTARDLLDIHEMNLDWCLPSRLAEHPMSWMIFTEEGLIIDARKLAREDQVVLANAGLIPFVYADRQVPPAQAKAAEPVAAPAPDAKPVMEPERSPQLSLF